MKFIVGVALALVTFVVLGIGAQRTTVEPEKRYAMRQDSHFVSGTKWQLAVGQAANRTIYAPRPQATSSYAPPLALSDDEDEDIPIPDRGYLPTRDE